MRRCGGKRCKHRIVLGIGVFGICCFPASLAADSMTGVVRNLTNGRPAAGDDVFLIGAAQDAQEQAHARTDAQGAFTLELHHPGKPHLVRVVHQGVNYDRQLSSADAIAIDVADATTKVKGITGGIEIIRVGSHGSLLHVSDMVEIKNVSNPPATQASERTFEVYLPGDAKIDSVLAAGPENIGTMISAMPVRGEPGHYSVDFPLRPGATKFAFNYDLPYDGRATFRPQNMYPLQQLAVMIPPTMTFASRSSAFQMLSVGNNRYKVEAAEQLKAGQGPEFELSGAGILPPIQEAQVQASPKVPNVALTAPAQTTSAGFEAHAQGGNFSVSGSSPVARFSAQSLRVQRWVLGAGALSILGTFGLLVLHRKHSRYAKTQVLVGASQVQETSAGLVDALKEGLFQLESDWLQGADPKEEYTSVKQALNGTIEWAIARAGARRGATTKLSPNQNSAESVLTFFK